MHVKDCGFECIALDHAQRLKLDMHVNRERAMGLATDPHGAMCAGKPMLADVFYTGARTQ